LAAHFIRLHTRPGDVVLDCFAGHGSTLVAAAQLGRRYIGIEIDPGYCAVAERRIAAALAQPRLPLDEEKPKAEQATLLEV